MTGEKREYQRLYELPATAGRTMTTSGSYSFTSLSSGTTYSTTTGGEYDVFLQLQTSLVNYGIIDTDFNNKVEVSAFNAHLADNAQTNDVHGLKTLFQTQQFANFIRGGSFESWSAGDAAAPDGFSGVGTPTIAKSTDAVEGKYSVEVTRTSATDPRVLSQAVYSTTSSSIAGRTFTATVRIKGVTVTGTGAYIVLDWRDSSGAQVTGAGTSNYYNGTTWSDQGAVKITATAPAGAVFFYVFLYIDTQNDVYRFDALQVVEGNLPVAFANHPNDQHMKAVDYQDSAAANYEYGLIAEQNGIVTIADTTSSKAVTFPKAFKKLLGIQVTPITSVETISAASGTTTGFTATRSGTAGANNVYWSAKGVI